MRHDSISPPAELAPFIEHVWSYESDHAHASDRVLPHPRPQLLIGLCDEQPFALITGPSTRPVSVETSRMRHVVGVCFRRGGLQPFIDVPSHELTDERVSVQTLWGDHGAVIRERILASRDAPTLALTRLLTERFRPDYAPDPVVSGALVGLESGRPVARVIEDSGWSRATVVRRFTHAVGLSPKRYASLTRFQRAVRQLANGQDCASVAHACGYFDQAHFTHEFSRYAGVSPGRYVPRSRYEPNHVRDR